MKTKLVFIFLFISIFMVACGGGNKSDGSGGGSQNNNAEDSQSDTETDADTNSDTDTDDDTDTDTDDDTDADTDTDETPLSNVGVVGKVEFASGSQVAVEGVFLGEAETSSSLLWEQVNGDPVTVADWADPILRFEAPDVDEALVLGFTLSGLDAEGNVLERELPGGETEPMVIEVGVTIFGESEIVDLPGATDCAAEVCADIRARRTSGVAPLAVFFDGTIFQADGQSFHSLHYEWDFRSGEDYPDIWQHTGKPKKQAFGPIAAHVYDEPGTYQVTLTVSDKAGNQETDTLEITVLSQDTLTHTYCYADINGKGGDFMGCPLDTNDDGICEIESSHCIPGNNIPNLGSVATASTRLLFRRGDTFKNSGGITRVSQKGPGVISAFGPGNQKPILEMVAGSGRTGMEDNVQDWRFHDIHLLAHGSSLLSAHGNDMLYYDVIAEGFDGCVVAEDEGEKMVRGLFVVDFDCRNLENPKGWKFFNIVEQSAFMGITIENGDVAEGNLRFMHAGKVLIQHNYLYEYPVSKQSISLRTCDALKNMRSGCEVGMPNFQVLVSDNIFHSNHEWTLNVEEQGSHQDMLFERNFIRYADAPDESLTGFAVASTQRVSVRNNIFYSDGGNSARLSGIGASGVWIYGNSVFTLTDGKTYACAEVGGIGECANNLMWGISPTAVANGGSLPGGGNLDQNSLGEFPFVGDARTVPEITDFYLKDSSAAYSGAVATDHYNAVDFFGNPRHEKGSVGAIEHSDSSAGSGSGGTNGGDQVSGRTVWQSGWEDVEVGKLKTTDDWLNYDPQEAGKNKWEVITVEDAISEGINVTPVRGDKLYRAEILNSNSSSHRAYPVVHFDQAGAGQHPDFPEGVPSPYVAQWWVWWDPDGGYGNWNHLATFSNTVDWEVHTINIALMPNGFGRLSIKNGDKVKTDQYFDGNQVPVGEWVKVTVYVDYNYNNGGGDNDGIEVVWVNNNLAAIGKGNHLSLTHSAEATRFLKRAHWGLYADGSSSAGRWFEDEMKIWTLDDTIDNYEVVPEPPAH